jgi:hypothetical protein
MRSRAVTSRGAKRSDRGANRRVRGCIAVESTEPPTHLRLCSVRLCRVEVTNARLESQGRRLHHLFLRGLVEAEADLRERVVALQREGRGGSSDCVLRWEEEGGECRDCDSRTSFDHAAAARVVRGGLIGWCEG